jgi:methanogenic corrinoid protein MtbC1
MSGVSSRAALLDCRDALAVKAVDLQYAAQPGVWEKYGAKGRLRALEDAGHHLSYLAEAAGSGQAALFLEYVRWLGTLFAGLRLPADALVSALECTGRAIRELAPALPVGDALAILELGLAVARAEPEPERSFLMEGGALAALAHEYLGFLLTGDRMRASSLVLEAARAGTPVKDIYLQVFQPCQRELGRMWQMNRISVAMEHACTAATQLVMSQLSTYVFGTPRIGRSMVAACVGGELHELGIRMVADLFEMQGWDTFYAGANTPTRDIVGAIAARGAELLALSATMTFHLPTLREVIGEVRASKAGGVRILVGGYPFNLAPGLWRDIGADGTGRDAAEALEALAPGA